MVCSEGRCLLPAFTRDDALRRLEEIGLIGNGEYNA